MTHAVMAAEGGKMSIFEAVEACDSEQVEALLDGGANPNATDRYGNTLLHLALCSNERPDSIFAVVKVLVKAGADTSARNRFGHTPLYLAGNRVPKEVADFIRKHGGRWY